MNRRKFCGISLAAVAALMLPATEVKALNFRKEKPAAWTAEHSPEAIKALYGDGKLEKTDKIKFTAPKLAENGGSIPINLKTDLDIESIALFQDANPRSLSTVFTVPEGAIVNYDFRIKMRKTALVTIVAKGRDGKLYTTAKEIDVSIGGCGG